MELSLTTALLVYLSIGCLLTFIVCLILPRIKEPIPDPPVIIFCAIFWLPVLIVAIPIAVEEIKRRRR